MTEEVAAEDTGAGVTLHLYEPSGNLLQIEAMATFLRDVQTVYSMAALGRMDFRSRESSSWTRTRRYDSATGSTSVQLRINPPPLVIRRVAAGSTVIDLAPLVTHGGIAVIIAAVGFALKHGPGNLGAWLAIDLTARAARQKARADIADDELRAQVAETALAEARLREQEANLALTRIRAIAPRLDVKVIDQNGREVPLNPSANPDTTQGAEAPSSDE